MTALGLTLMGLAPSVVVLAVYWVGRRIDHARAAVKAANVSPELEVLRLRAMKVAARSDTCAAATSLINEAIKAGDSQVLLALLREERATP